MLHPDDNDQSTVPYRPVTQASWSPIDEKPYQEETQPYQPTVGENTYQPETQASRFPGRDSSRTVQQEKLSVRSSPPLYPPLGKSSGRGLRTTAIVALTLVIATVFGIGLFAGWQFGRTSGNGGTATNPMPALQPGTNSVPTVPPLTGNNINTVRAAAIAKVRPAVVQINVGTSRGEQGGSGVIVDKRGYIVTNYHVIQGAQSIEVVFADGNEIQNVQIAGNDLADDLAVLKITPPANMVVATLGDSSQLQAGQEVLAIGNPLGITETVTHGIISALGSNVPGRLTIPNAIQTDAPINPGNSGGALADLQGNVIGIPTLTAVDPEFNTPANGVGFAIPINKVKLIVPQIIENGKVAHTGRAVLGIRVSDVDDYLQAMGNLSVDHGVFITRVLSDGPAAQAGLQQGDVIVGINGKKIDNLSALGDMLDTKAPRDKVSVEVYRGDQKLTFNVTLGELEAE